MPTTSKAFDAAAELSRNDKSGKTSTEDMLRGYGLYKVVMTGVGVLIRPILSWPRYSRER